MPEWTVKDAVLVVAGACAGAAQRCSCLGKSREEEGGEDWRNGRGGALQGAAQRAPQDERAALSEFLLISIREWISCATGRGRRAAQGHRGDTLKSCAALQSCGSFDPITDAHLNGGRVIHMNAADEVWLVP